MEFIGNKLILISDNMYCIIIIILLLLVFDFMGTTMPNLASLLWGKNYVKKKAFEINLLVLFKKYF